MTLTAIDLMVSPVRCPASGRSGKFSVKLPKRPPNYKLHKNAEPTGRRRARETAAAGPGTDQDKPGPYASFRPVALLTIGLPIDELEKLHGSADPPLAHSSR